MHSFEYKNVKGRSLRLNFYDAVNPRSSACPVVIWIHGDGWEGGNHFVQDEGVRSIRLHGVALVSIEYRLSGESPFPAQILDCRDAVRWVRKNAERLQVNPQRIGVWGDQAGGHLAALLGTDAFSSLSASVQAVCNWCGPTDLKQYLRSPESGKSNPPLSRQVKKLLGAAENWVENADRASPVRYADSPFPLPPFLTVHGTEDDVVAPAQSEALHSSLKECGQRSTLLWIPGAGHGFDPAKHARAYEASYNFFLAHL